MEKCGRFVLYNNIKHLPAKSMENQHAQQLESNVWGISPQTFHLIFHELPDLGFGKAGKSVASHVVVFRGASAIRSPLKTTAWEARKSGDNSSIFPKFVLRCVTGYVVFMVYILIDNSFRPMNVQEFSQKLYKQLLLPSDLFLHGL